MTGKINAEVLVNRVRRVTTGLTVFQCILTEKKCENGDGENRSGISSEDKKEWRLSCHLYAYVMVLCGETEEALEGLI